MTQSITLPDSSGTLSAYSLCGKALPSVNFDEHAPSTSSSRIVLAACHVVADPLSATDPLVSPAVDWSATLAFRHHLDSLGLGIAEAMDTAQRGMGLDWPLALELIKRTRDELPNALVFNGCGTDHLEPAQVHSLDDIERAYFEQLEAIQSTGARVILMASRALARVAQSADDYQSVYSNVLKSCNEPVILHWLGDMFDPALSGYWGSTNLATAMDTCLSVIDSNQDKIDGIKVSLLDKDQEINMRRRLPETVRMYTGDDFNYPELIAGDDQGYSDALLGIFDPIAPLAALALKKLDQNDVAGFHSILDPTVPLARHIFKAPTQFYKTGVVFLAWLNGHQDHFVMVGGSQSQRSLPHLAELFRLADGCGLLADPEQAARRFQTLLTLYGIKQ